jgi:hypothetical protein
MFEWADAAPCRPLISELLQGLAADCLRIPVDGLGAIYLQGFKSNLGTSTNCANSANTGPCK